MDPITRFKISEGATLGELAARHPGASRAFRAYGLDYCCGGRRRLADACRDSGLDATAVLAAIEGHGADRQDVDWSRRPLAALVQHIVERYHEKLRAELPELRRMAETVEAKHAEKEACPKGLSRHLAFVHEAVLSHLEKEERILFPLILSGRGAQAVGPIQVMEMEHRDHGENLERIRVLTADLVAPPEACATWQALYLRLGELEADLMDHIHLENNVLFPRALYE